MKKIATILLMKALRIPFEILKAYKEFIGKRNMMMEKIPKPRRRQWWEKVMEKEFEFLYDKAKKQMKEAPVKYRDLYEMIIEHKLMRHIILIQRYFRKRKMKKWLEAHNYESGMIV